MVDLDWVLKIQNSIRIAKYDSPLKSANHSTMFTLLPELNVICEQRWIVDTVRIAK